jgi:hypothetical protein
VKQFDIMSPKVWVRALLVLGLVFTIIGCFMVSAKEVVQSLATIAAGAIIAMAILEKQGS